LAGVHRGGLSGRVALESVVFLVQLKNVLILYFGTGFELKKSRHCVATCHACATVLSLPLNAALIAQLHQLKCYGFVWKLLLHGYGRTLMSDNDFEDRQQPARRPVVPPVRVRDVAVAEIPREADRRICESDLNADKQVFYFSKKLFEFISGGVSEERILLTGQKHSAQKQGVLVKRAERKNRADKLRDFVQLKQLQKPSGSVHAANKRKRSARNKSTDFTMGRSRDARKRHASQESDQSQQPESSQRLGDELDAPLSQPTAPHSQTNVLPIKRKRHLWATHPVPNTLPLAKSIPAAVLQVPVLSLPDFEKSELEEGDHEETHDNGGEGGDFNEDIPRPSKNPRVSRPYTAFEQECKRFLVKWGNNPAILTQAKVLITDYDNALGDVSAYRTGRPSSKPTYQGSRRR
jgi:hypothetical protein